jgi:hypothetical protein
MGLGFSSFGIEVTHIIIFVLLIFDIEFDCNHKDEHKRFIFLLRSINKDK